MKSFIHFERVSKKFGSATVVDELDFSVGEGEFVSLLGPSGSGKTTLLMMLAGFEMPSSGAILVDGRHVENLPPYRRDMGVVFQNYALFPHMTVAENIAFPLKMRRVGASDRRARSLRALDLVKLSHVADRKPAQLSGGQQQRIALARALVYEPKVVLMDEPLSALDKQLREHMQLEIRDLHRQLGLTVIFVTHDQGEALTMSDRVAVLNRGKIEQLDTPSALYDKPRTRFVAEFIGETNLFSGRLVTVEGRRGFVELLDGTRVACGDRLGFDVGEPVFVSVRPEMVQVGSRTTENVLKATVVDRVYHGDHLKILLRRGEATWTAKVSRKYVQDGLESDTSIGFDASDCTLVAP